MVSHVSKTLKTFHGGTSNIIHTALIVTAVRFVTIGETPIAPMPKTTQELLDCVAGIRLGCERAGYVAHGLEAGLPPAAYVHATRAIPWRPWGDWAIVMQTSSCNGHFVKGTKASLFAELTTEGQTSLLKEYVVGDTIVHEIPVPRWSLEQCIIAQTQPCLPLTWFQPRSLFSQAWNPRSRRSQGC